MTDAWGSLHVEVRGDEITVSLPGASYRVVYRKSAADKSGLRATSRSGRWEDGTLMTQAEFNARAWAAANEKRGTWGGCDKRSDSAQPAATVFEVSIALRSEVAL
jgi:hypothetical protein